METDELTEHLKVLIKDCNKFEYKEITKHIHSLMELIKYKNMEKESSQITEKKIESFNHNEEEKRRKEDEKEERRKEDEKKEKEYVEILTNIESIQKHRKNYLPICFVITSIIFILTPIFIICMLHRYIPNTMTLYILYFIAYTLFIFCFSFIYKYEHNSRMKDKELSNELKKMLYQGKINKILKQ